MPDDGVRTFIGRLENALVRLPLVVLLHWSFSQPRKIEWTLSSVFNNTLFEIEYVVVLMLAALPNDTLYSGYRLILPMGVLYLSYITNQYTIIGRASHTYVSKDLGINNWAGIMDDHPVLFDNMAHILVQTFLAYSFCRLFQRATSPSILKTTFGIPSVDSLPAYVIRFLLPIIFRWFWAPTVWLGWLVFMSSLSVCIPFAKLLFTGILKQVGSRPIRQHVLELSFGRPGNDFTNTLIVFWISRAVLLLFYSLISHCSTWWMCKYLVSGQSLEFASDWVWSFYLLICDVVAQSSHLILASSSVVSLTSMRYIVALISQNIAYLVSRAVGCHPAVFHEIGSDTASVFIKHVLVINLWGMDETRRLPQLYLNTCVLAMVLTHYLHDSLRQLYIENNALRNLTEINHTRVVGVFIGLIVCAGVILSGTLDTDPWLYIAMVALFAELVIKIIITLLHYALVVVELRNTARGEDVDLEVYRHWTSYAENTLDFIFKFSFACCGIWLYITEYYNPVFALCLVTAGFKISWKILLFLTFMFEGTYITAAIDMIPMAQLDQVRNYADVCSICYNELQEATSLVLPCKHIFHRECLLELFKHQSFVYKCPICQKFVFGDAQAQLLFETLEHQNAQEHAHILEQENAQLRACILEQENAQLRACILEQENAQLRAQIACQVDGPLDSCVVNIEIE